jgi:hypothetical protein
VRVPVVDDEALSNMFIIMPSPDAHMSDMSYAIVLAGNGCAPPSEVTEVLYGVNVRDSSVVVLVNMMSQSPLLLWSIAKVAIASGS